MQHKNIHPGDTSFFDLDSQKLQQRSTQKTNDNSQAILIKQLNCLFKAKHEQRPSPLELKPEEIIYFNVERAGRDFNHLLDVIDYRIAQQKKCARSVTGYCFGLLILLWINYLKGQESQFLESLQLVMNCQPEQILKIERIVKTFLPDVEYFQWSMYHSFHQLAQKDIDFSIQMIKDIPIKKVIPITNKKWNLELFKAQINQLPNNGLLVLINCPPPEKPWLKHAVGIIRQQETLLFFDANNENLQPKKFELKNLATIFNQELINSFYKRLQLDVPLITPLNLELEIMQLQCDAMLKLQPLPLKKPAEAKSFLPQKRGENTLAPLVDIRIDSFSPVKRRKISPSQLVKVSIFEPLSEHIIQIPESLMRYER